MIMLRRIVLTFHMYKVLLITTAMFACSATGKNKEILVLFVELGKIHKIINIVKNQLILYNAQLSRLTISCSS